MTTGEVVVEGELAVTAHYVLSKFNKCILSPL